MEWKNLRHKPRDLNPVTWIVIAQYIRHMRADVNCAIETRNALAEYIKAKLGRKNVGVKTTRLLTQVLEHSAEAMKEADDIARRLGGKS